MRIGMIDCDKKNQKNPFPNIALMKLSAWHKRKGDSVEWYESFLDGHFDRVYVSKVFSFSPDYEYFIDADEVIRGGVDFAYLWLTELKFMKNRKMIRCRMKSNTFIQTIRFMGLKILHMDF